MKQVARKGLFTAMVAGGALASAGYAHADAGAGGDTVGSPGVLSGNSVQIPVHVPVNLCGNTVSVAGLLNPSSGNGCANVSPGGGPAAGPAAGQGTGGTRSTTTGGSASHGETKGSPGLLSGNGLQLPIDLPVNITGNSVSVVGIGNASSGNVSSNRPDTPPVRTLPAPPRLSVPVPAGHQAPLVQAEAGESLAHTGTDSLGFTVPAGAALLIGGTVLYRRSRPRT
ncbi:chaplin [Streptomyces sp. RKAG293]|uniref:chaplin n=1 Tax=Streptomyces sp. RKAG293 TaxID=2893403 RepID=UPI002034915B|nr:chaplin [Streptomyces sp. RKAG293]MCM2423476.1 chaplin [Streptomyces sp. RKAG293]